MIEWTDAQKEVLTGEGNMLVSASAGSGKTTIMLERVLTLLKNGHELNRFLIMTFSNASAAEMREKLIQKLYDEIRTTGNAHLRKQLELLNFSNISTIHSFCMSLYKKHFADIGYDSAFELMDEKEALLLFLQCTDTVIEQYLGKEDKAFFLLCERFVKARDILPLKEVIKNILKFLEVQVDEESFIKKAIDIFEQDLNRSPAIKFFMDYHTRILRRYESDGNRLLREIKACGLKEVYIDIINDINNNITSIYKSKDIERFAFAVNDAQKVKSLPGGKKDESIKELIEEIKDFKGAITKYLAELKDCFDDGTITKTKGSVEDIKKLLEITLIAKVEYQKQKTKKRRFDFADLSKVALKILEDKGRREAISSQFDFVFVDEYQDTDYIQERIMNLVAQKNNLFMVGDPKQAIYQFRYAEPKIFIDRYYKYSQKKEGRNQNLNDNFRSDKRVLDFVNLVFNEVMNYEFGGVDYKNSSELIAGIKYPIVSSLPAVEIATYNGKEVKEPLCGVYSVKENTIKEEVYSFEGNYIGNRIEELVSSHYIYDTYIKEKRRVEYSDIAILMFKRNAMDILDELKRRDIPYSAPGFKEARLYEIDLLVDYVRIIDNMANDIPLSAVMQSPIYNFSPYEMLEIRKINKKGSFWQSLMAYKGTQNIENKIITMLEDLEKFRNMSAYCNVYQLLLRILDNGFDAYLLSKGKDPIENVNSFINSIKNKDYGRNITLFLEYFDNVYQNDTTPPSFGNSVKVMTIHGSKGLEFPIVFVARADAGFTSNHDNNKDVYIDAEFGIAMKGFDAKDKLKYDTVITRSFKLKSQYKEKEELLRLMYVAFTRAKNHLFIVGKESNCKQLYPDMQASFMEWVSLARQKNAIINKYCVDMLRQENVVKKEKALIESKSLDLSELEFDYYYQEATKLPAKYSVSALKDTQEDTFEEKKSYLSKEESIGRGIAYHKIMELIDFSKKERDEIQQQINEFVQHGFIESAELKGIDIGVVENVLNSQLIKYALKNKFFREKQFMLYVPMNEIMDSENTEKVLVQGVIDILILGEENIIVDFKVTQNSDEVITQRYKKQLDLYALAVEKLMKITVHKKIIYIINKNKIINV